MSGAPGPEPRPCRVIQLEAADQRWDAFVLAAPGATVFHHSGWLAALETEYGQRALKLACEEPDGTLSGILPLMVTRGLPLGIGGAGARPAPEFAPAHTGRRPAGNQPGRSQGPGRGGHGPRSRRRAPAPAESLHDPR